MEAVFVAIGTHGHEFASIVVGDREGDEARVASGRDDVDSRSSVRGVDYLLGCPSLLQAG